MTKIKEPSKRPKAIRLILRFFVILLVLVFLIAGGFLIYLNVKKNDISKELLQSVNNELKGDFSVNNISLGSLFSYPILDINLQGLQFKAPDGPLTHGELILDVKAATLKANLSEVLSSKIYIENIYIKGATLYVERDSSGNSVIGEGFRPLNPRPVTQDSSKLVININRLQIEELVVSVIDRPTDVVLPFRIKDVKGNFKLENNVINGGVDVDILPVDFPFMETLFLNDLPIQLTADYTVNIDRDLVMVKCNEFHIGDEHYSLNYHYDFTDKPYMDFQMGSVDTGVDLETLFTQELDTVEDQESIRFLGQVHYRSRVYWNPDSEESFFEAIEASFDIEGKNLMIYGVDLDDGLDKFKRSQSFNLADIGAVMFAGPAGLAVTKGSDFARLAFTKAGDSTLVNHFMAAWEMKKGRLATRDVALSTKNNLITTDGWYQIQNDSLDFKFSILDKRGCELVGQRIYGNVKEPEYGKVKLLKTLMGPVTNFFRNIGMAKCDTIYKGSVKFPKE